MFFSKTKNLHSPPDHADNQREVRSYTDAKSLRVKFFLVRVEPPSHLQKRIIYSKKQASGHLSTNKTITIKQNNEKI